MRALIALAAVVFVIGMAGGSIDVGGNTMLVWLFGDAVGPSMNALHFFFGVGALISPLVIARVLAWGGGITGAYWLLSLLLLPAVFLLIRLPSPTIPYQKDGDSAVKPRWLLVLLIAAMFFFFVGAELSYGGWIYTYALSLGLATMTTAGYLTSLFWGALTLGRLVNIPIAARVRPRYMLMADIAGLIISLMLLLLWPASSIVVWIATFGMGFAMASAFATLMGLGGHHIDVTGRITSLFLVGGSLGSMTVPWLIGQFFEPYGAQTMVLWILASVIAAALALGAFLWAVKGDKPMTLSVGG
jgi:FHS family Na+ dependent glucose MFS transporter 1